jgi:hypothetical protein
MCLWRFLHHKEVRNFPTLIVSIYMNKPVAFRTRVKPRDLVMLQFTITLTQLYIYESDPLKTKRICFI